MTRNIVPFTKGSMDNGLFNGQRKLCPALVNTFICRSSGHKWSTHPLCQFLAEINPSSWSSFITMYIFLFLWAVWSDPDPGSPYCNYESKALRGSSEAETISRSQDMVWCPYSSKTCLNQAASLFRWTLLSEYFMNHVHDFFPHLIT
jgi:hypothetical protein